jgi:hypothetical protein
LVQGVKTSSEINYLAGINILDEIVSICKNQNPVMIRVSDVVWFGVVWCGIRGE